jgi:hypothetical protein
MIIQMSRRTFYYRPQRTRRLIFSAETEEFDAFAMLSW